MTATSQELNRFCKRIIAAAALPAVVAVLGTASALAAPLPGAIFTTDSTCSGVNLNIYINKGDVYIDGGPAHPGAASLPSGQCYYVQVTDPSGAIVLGTSVGATDPTPFCVAADGTIDCDRLIDILIKGSDGTPGYDDTPNNGSEYKVWVSTEADFVNDSTKTDNFKVLNKDSGPPPEGGFDLLVAKDGDGLFDQPYTWTINKAVDKTLVRQVGGNATFNYTVTVTRTAGAAINYRVSGTISILNPNAAAVTDVVVTDSLNDASASCTIDGTASPITVTVPPGLNEIPYTCSFSGAPASLTETTNTVTISWPAQTLADATVLLAGSDSFEVPIVFSQDDEIDECVTVTDVFDGGTTTTIGTTCESKEFEYSQTVPVPQFGCVDHDNTATFETNDTKTTDSDSETVTVCGPVQTGALTMGFWQNKNGQAIISAANQYALRTWLRTYHPFSDAPSTGLAAYVLNIIKVATCTSSSKTCNSMLRAQMLATALDVYFSDPALGGNRIGAPSPIGNQAIDLTSICGAIGSCGSFEDVSSVFGGATCLTVQAMLNFQNTATADPLVDAGANWYGQNKAKQVLAKDAFDAINNQVVFNCP